ncbi:MAG: AraC family transcriptional regulator [Bacillota bacterium]|nr:AraC family transcriptional regulator [Bacillota bacterium]
MKTRQADREHFVQLGRTAAAELAAATDHPVTFLSAARLHAALERGLPYGEQIRLEADLSPDEVLLYTHARMARQALKSSRPQRYLVPDDSLCLIAAIGTPENGQVAGALLMVWPDAAAADAAQAAVLAACEGLLAMVADWLAGHAAGETVDTAIPVLCSSADEARIREAAGSGDARLCRRLINDIFMRMYLHGAGDMGRLRVHAVELTAMVIRLVTEFEGPGILSDWPAAGYHLEIWQCPDLFSLTAWLGEAIRDLTERIFDPLPQVNSALVREALRRIDAAPAAGHRLIDIAAELHVSEAHLGQLIREQTGRTFPVCLNEIRLRHARRLLRDTETSVAAVAAACGYRDAPYFIRVFKRYNGVTPAVWRRQLRRGSTRRED